MTRDVPAPADDAIGECDARLSAAELAHLEARASGVTLKQIEMRLRQEPELNGSGLVLGDQNRSGLSNCSHGRIYSASIGLSLVLISGLSRKTMFNKELWTSSFPLYSIKPSLRNLFMKKLTRERVVPIISASVS
jgi:hypothetical protein